MFYKGRICVPSMKALTEEIMEEARCSRYAIHLGSTKMYQNLRKEYRWNNMKREIVKYIKGIHDLPKGRLNTNCQEES